MTITETTFINNEIRVWGLEYIEDLLNRGYVPTLTTKGWSWMLPPVNVKVYQTNTVNRNTLVRA